MARSERGEERRVASRERGEERRVASSERGEEDGWRAAREGRKTGGEKRESGGRRCDGERNGVSVETQRCQQWALPVLGTPSAASSSRTCRFSSTVLSVPTPPPPPIRRVS